MRNVMAVLLLALIGLVGYSQSVAPCPTPPCLPPGTARIISPSSSPPLEAAPGLDRQAVPGEPKVVKLRPSAIFSGSHSAIRMNFFTLVHHEGGWKDLWAQHRGKDRDPPFTERSQQLDINFESQYVVAVFTGDDWNLTVATFTRGDTVLIRVAAHGYQTEGYPGQKDERSAHQKAKDRAAAEYCFVVLPRPMKVVIIEEDVNRQLGEPAIWRERVRFTPPGDNE